jgi:hypothetical protein
MSMNEKRKQVAAQCRAVALLAGNLADIYGSHAVMFDSAGPSDDILDIAGRESGRHMEVLGDILNGMDAVTHEDEAATRAAFAGRAQFGYLPLDEPPP